jgi:integrase
VENWQRSLFEEKVAAGIPKSCAITTINGILRNAKSLFSKKNIRKINRIGLKNPFEHVFSMREGSHRYVSRMDPKELLSSAVSELSHANPEGYKIFLLALGCGLRRNEIDKLEWSSVDLGRREIRVCKTDFFDPKTKDSDNLVNVPKFVAGELKRLRANDGGRFVVASVRSTPRKSKNLAIIYRCENRFKNLIAWLRKKGVGGMHPLHSLRKEYVSQIAAERGIYAASQAARHSSCSTTETFYASRPADIVPSFISEPAPNALGVFTDRAHPGESGPLSSVHVSLKIVEGKLIACIVDASGRQILEVPCSGEVPLGGDRGMGKIHGLALTTDGTDFSTSHCTGAVQFADNYGLWKNEKLALVTA